MASHELRTRLTVAATTGEVVAVVYHPGSQPGTVREIIPHVVGDAELDAHDVAAGINKTFRLAHLELAESSTAAPRYVAVEGGQSLADALQPHVDALRALGWHVKIAATSVSVHRYFKNGKPRKGADVMMMFTEFAIDAFDDGSGWREDAVRPKRPYYVASPNFERAQTFTHLPPAVACFLNESRAAAPGSTRMG
jgi:hypothetical protein